MNWQCPVNWRRPVNWRLLLKRGQQERELDAELRFHFESAVADHVRGGMSEPEARRSARLQFGGLEKVREECRDARGRRWLEDLWKDIGYALRTLRHNPGFAAIALLTLALGSGSSAVMFTVINGVSHQLIAKRFRAATYSGSPGSLTMPPPKRHAAMGARV